MKRTFALLLAALAAAAVLEGLVHVVLVAAHVSEPAATTLYGPTLRRLWATSAVALALVGVVIGGLALARPAGRFGTASPRRGPATAGANGITHVRPLRARPGQRSHPAAARSPPEASRERRGLHAAQSVTASPASPRRRTASPHGRLPSARRRGLIDCCGDIHVRSTVDE